MTVKTEYQISADDKTKAGLDSARKNFSAFEKGAKGAADSVSDAFTKLAGPLLGAVSAAQGLSKLVSVTREFDVLNAGLITATGSAENAAIAFGAIQQFAATTPYDIQQVTDSFIKLTNYGLRPSERAINAYGDTASAMGKSLDQMVEAVADAATGEFERLKEFGIKASKQGDEVQFTFRGVTTTVKNSSAEIQDYLIALGENNFAGAMAQRMDSLDGALSNLGDSWDQLFLNISKQGAGDLITDSVRIAISAIDELNAMLASGQLQGYFKAYASGFSGFSQDIQNAIAMFEDELLAGESATEETIDFIVSAFRDLPQNVRAFLQILVVEMVSTFDKLVLNAEAVKDRFKAVFTDDTIDAVNERLYASLDGVNAVRQDSISAILAERDAAIASYNDQIVKADEARAKFEEAAAAKSGGDSLAQFEVGGGRIGGGEESGATGSGSGQSEEEKFIQRIEQLRAQNLTELEVEQEKYDNGLALLDQALAAEVLKQEEYNLMRESIEAKHEANLTKISAKGLSDREKFLAKSGKDQTKQVFGDLANITAGVANHNKGLFELNKAAGIANAIINTYEGVSKSLSAYPMPLAAVMAAAHLASGMAQVAAIKSTQFGSGSAGATSVGGAPVTTAPSNIAQLPQQQTAEAVQEKPQTVYINIEPDANYNGRQLRQLMEQLSEQAGFNVKFGT